MLWISFKLLIYANVIKIILFYGHANNSTSKGEKIKFKKKKIMMAHSDQDFSPRL